MVSCHSYKILTKSRLSSPIPFLKYFVPNYSWRDAIISKKKHVYLRHRKADLSLVKLTRAHDLLSSVVLSRANEFVSRAHNLPSRAHDLLSHAHEIVSCAHDLVSRRHELVSRAHDI